MEKRSTTIKIAGVEYSITGYETEEYMEQVAKFVDKKMKEVKQKCFNLDTSMLAVLTAVNIADENFKLYERVEELQEINAQLQSELNQAKQTKNNQHKK